MGLLLYLGLNIALIPLLSRSDMELHRHLAVGTYLADLLFASLLIYHTGGLLSQLFLLYCLLPFKAALYYPYISNIIYFSFLIFPFYAGTLYLDTGTLFFLSETLFLHRYTLLLLTIFAGMYTAWHLDRQHQQTRDLYVQVDERRRELRTIIDSIADGVLVVDSELHLLMINPVAADMFNLPFPAPPKAPLSDLLTNETLLDLLRQALENHPEGDILFNQELEARPTSSDKPIICQALATSLSGEEHEPRGAVVVLRDMTRQKELDELKSNFIAMLSHELRTPLTVIRGFIELILSGGAGDVTTEQQNTLQVVFKQTEKLQTLIDTLLGFAELEASEIDLEIGPVSLDQILDSVLRRIQPLAQDQSINVQTMIAPTLPPIDADAEMLEQVLLNLLENAIKFTPQGGKVKVTIQDQKGEFLFCVSDTGPGVPVAERDRIFERFYQIDSSSTRQYGGTGLGLAICKRLVEAHQGRIWVEESQLLGANGHPGSRFCFTVPHDLLQRTSTASQLSDGA